MKKDIIELYKVNPTGMYIFIAFCKDEKTMLDMMKKDRAIQAFIKRKGCDVDDLEVGDALGMFFHRVKDKMPLGLYINRSKDKLEMRETLVHELNHAIFYLSRWFHFQEEREFMAHMQGMMYVDLCKLFGIN